MSSRARSLLLPFVPLYAAALKLQGQSSLFGRKRRRSLNDAVLSIGSISAGGAGKTPVVLALAEMLQHRGYKVRILTRGYKRAGRAVERVDPAGDADRYGDEPLLLARRSGVPVYVGADRYEAGRMAQDTMESGMIVHLLDDGFQHRQLKRDLDLVLLTRKEVTDGLLPAGDLREPLSGLRRADVLILREEEAKVLEEFLGVLMRGSEPPTVWQIRRSLRFSAARATPHRPLAFCGIARPENFMAMLRAEGQTTSATVFFPDHHRYTERDIRRLLSEARRHQADGFMTTEKDAVKLSLTMRKGLEQLGPLVAPELAVHFVDERAVLEQLLSKVKRLNRRRDGGKCAF